MTQFINDKQNLVTEAIDGLLATAGGQLYRLDGYPHIKVVCRSDWDKSKVALISGGGSGHEPAHAGFVGQGLLTAAVCGEVFASPSVDAVLAGILAVTGSAGCLLVVKNYTGDRLNFGLAAERARAMGLKVEMVVVDDDIALPDLPQARGVAGTLFVHKIAGAMAEQGATLDQVTHAAQQVIDGTSSIGTSLDTCTVPGSPKEDRISAGNVELGLGIHGEPGVEQVACDSARQAMQLVVDKLKPVMGGKKVVALLNNLGGTTPLEMSVLANELVSTCDNVTHVIGPSLLMTSLDMHGFSVSVIDADESQLTALAAPVGASAWPPMQAVNNSYVQPVPEGLAPQALVASEDAATRATIEQVCDLLVAAQSDLNELDAKSGDGDTGSTLATAAGALKQSLSRMPLAEPDRLMRALGNELSQTMGGSSGVIMAIFFNASGDACAAGASVEASLLKGLERVSQVGGAVVGDRTMIDALQPALEALPGGLEKAAAAARKGADNTATIGRAKAGRAAYVPEDNLIGNNDPGAEAVARVFEGLATKS